MTRIVDSGTFPVGSTRECRTDQIGGETWKGGEVARIAVIGGGISGLAAARELRKAGHQPTVYEAGARVGGALRTSEIEGVPVDEGADAFLIRVPAGIDLAREVGATLVHPAARQAGILINGTLRPLPRSVLGVPLHPMKARSTLGLAGALRAERDRRTAPTPYDAAPFNGDIAVGAFLRKRLGDAVVDRLVEPLLGGVYAGHADQLSLATVLPQLHDPSGTSVLHRANEITPPASAAPVFASLERGLGSFPAMVAEGLDVRLDTAVTGLLLRRDGTWLLELGSRAGRPLQAGYDGVVLAVPASRARKLLAATDAVAAELAGGTDYASVAIVTIAFPRATSGLLPEPANSGWLVPPSAGRVVKAVTVSTSKWQHLRDGATGLVIVRASVGRYGEERDLQRDDRELVGVVAAEVAAVADVRDKPAATRVTRWGGALPQYTPGHLDRVRQLRARLPKTLTVCGAAFDGVGIPACIASGQRAAQAILDAWPRVRSQPAN